MSEQSDKDRLVVIVAEQNYQQIAEAFDKLQAINVVIELRLDYLVNFEIEKLKQVITNCTKPIILTLRTKAQGGHFQGSKLDYQKRLLECMNLNASYLDVEPQCSSSFITQLKQQNKATKLIRSYHDFEKTPDDLMAIYEKLSHPDISIYKIIGYAHDCLDSLRMLNFVSEQSQRLNIIAHCMGEQGEFSRVVGKAVGNYFTYCSFSQQSDSCILSLDKVLTHYRLDKINSQSKFYALLGDPVAHSIGDVFHNQQFEQQRINACYVKIKVTQEQLPSALARLKLLPFAGFSITTPLKETVIAIINQPDNIIAHAQSCNTLKLSNGIIYGTNTDGLAVCDLIDQQTKLADSRIIILGAGGTAKAICQALFMTGVKSLIVINRTLGKAMLLAEKFAAEAMSFDDCIEKKISADVIVSTLPNSVFNDAAMNNCVKYLQKNCKVYCTLDYQTEMKLPELGKIISITAKDVFFKQAQKQLGYWFAE